jgi:SpoVK/Ycf46/Vps4 family AAA+-type ATPase
VFSSEETHMLNPNKSHPHPLLREENPQPTEAPYDIVRLPNMNWQRAGEALVPDPQNHSILLRYGHYLREEFDDEIYRLIVLSGPSGTGKTVTAKWIGDAWVRAMAVPGNGIVIKSPRLFSENLGKSPQLAAALMEGIEVSARNRPTVAIFDDAETILLSRQHSLESHDPTDVMKVTTAIFHGLDQLRYNRQVLMFATLNMQHVVDPAVEDRSDLYVPFYLPNLYQRTMILRNKVQGTAGERVLTTLAAATEGKSGRQLAKINMMAYVYGTADTPKETTEADYLRAVGLTPGTEATQTTPYKPGPEPVTADVKEGEERCKKLFVKGYRGPSLLQKSKLLLPSRWFEAPPDSSNFRA